MRIFAARENDAHQGWVWLCDPSLAPRSVVKITNPTMGKSVYCEALQIDASFCENYNQTPRVPINDPENSLVIGAWYRAALGSINTQSDVPLKIKANNSWFGKFRACVDHPQVVVRLSISLGGIGLLLGVFGLALGLINFY